MCGILFVNNTSNNQEFVKRLEKMFPRGPDEFRVHMYSKCIMGHTRNCITNPMGGEQPIERGDWVVIHNGEIYNGMDNI